MVLYFYLQKLLIHFLYVCVKNYKLDFGWTIFFGLFYHAFEVSYICGITHIRLDNKFKPKP